MRKEEKSPNHEMIYTFTKEGNGKKLPVKNHQRIKRTK